ncbi:DUF1616 domain-containing protein [Halodesulfurarchaeum formicicum]|nr:DUF1616 domain-containing protein [Halodesulfurarchaeum formicicum]
MSSQVTDLRLVFSLTVAAMLVLLVPGVPWQIEWVFGLPLLVLLPGYAVVAALFPRRPEASPAGGNSLDWPARFGLSLIGSAIVVAAVGVLFASEALVRLTLAPAVLSIGAVTLLAVVLAGVRRRPLERDHRADPVAGVSLGSMPGAFGISGVQSLVLVVSVLLLVSTLAFAGTSPAEDPYTEVYLTDGEDLDLGPAEGTQTMATGADSTVSLTIENHEGDPTDYRTVVRLQRVENGTVLGSERLDNFSVSLASEEIGVYERSLNPTMTGERLRLQVLVYKGGTEGEIDADSADLGLRLWVDTTAEGST